MRLWTLHPKYLDAAGLVALWREALLAQAVLRGHTRGYRSHPQLQRFRECPAPRSAINAYLAAVHAEAMARGYGFDRSKLARVVTRFQIRASDGQLMYEWAWLLRKLERRHPVLYRRNRSILEPDAHPLFKVVPGPVAAWERVPGRTSTYNERDE